MEVVREHGSSIDKVTRWVDRWYTQEKELKRLEQAYQAGTLKKQDYQRCVQAFLEDEERSGAPRTFSESQKQQIIALAAQKPEDAGVPITHWSQEILAQTAIEKEIVVSISSVHVGRFLKSSNSTAA
jgi:transposase